MTDQHACSVVMMLICMSHERRYMSECQRPTVRSTDDSLLHIIVFVGTTHFVGTAHIRYGFPYKSSWSLVQYSVRSTKCMTDEVCMTDQLACSDVDMYESRA